MYLTKPLLFHLTETWRKVIGMGLIVAVAFVDCRKAFDSVPHHQFATMHWLGLPVI